MTKNDIKGLYRGGKSLPAGKLEETADFIECLGSKERKAELAESDMGGYLNQPALHEEMLAAGEIKRSSHR